MKTIIFTALISMTLFSSCVNLFQSNKSQNFVVHYKHSLSQVAESLDNDFFDNNYLISFILEQPSTALNYYVKSVLSDGSIILANRPPVTAGMALSYWTIIIELDNSFAPDEFNVVFPDESRWWADPDIEVTIHRKPL